MSGVGKGTVREELFKDDSLNLRVILFQLTTRENLDLQKQMGVDYFLLMKKAVDKIAQGGLLE